MSATVHDAASTSQLAEAALSHSFRRRDEPVAIVAAEPSSPISVGALRLLALAERSGR